MSALAHTSCGHWGSAGTRDSREAKRICTTAAYTLSYGVCHSKMQSPTSEYLFGLYGRQVHLLLAHLAHLLTRLMLPSAFVSLGPPHPCVSMRQRHVLETCSPYIIISVLFPSPNLRKRREKIRSATRTVHACPSGGQVSRARSSRPSPRRFRRSVGRRASGARARAEGACPFVLLASRPGVVFLVETRPAERHRRRRFQPPERAARQHRAPARQLWRAGGGGPRGEGEGRLSAC